MKFLIIVAIVLSSVFAIASVVNDYMAIPIVGVDQNGDCRWVKTVGNHEIQTRKCPVELPKRYHKEYIYFDDSLTGDGK